MRPTLTIVILFTATTLAGCASATTDAGTVASSTPTTTAVSPSEATRTATRGATPTPTITPLTLSREQAAERYLAIIRPYNVALEKLEQAINSGEPLATQTALAAETAEELETEIGQLRGTAWPPEVRTQVDGLVAASENAVDHWSEAASAQTRDDLIQAVLAAAEFDGTDAASTIRELLDLDSYDERDY
ncbi:MAG: hypothetical protein GEV28_02320 [Actinophytocola sp.]|uniref:hypothetical protein n=1 Tax=Actinophytocola sp. TaxID=1872138 RepID=UPI0013243BE9|nr:hypothetical protein [Actinophytocola sp.]MPZ79278.1 hypothetical protein [Actinophytocola sp.]